MQQPAAQATIGEEGGLRLAFAGGGTGGHIVPGLHLLAELERSGTPPSDLLWFHSGRAVEERVLRGLEGSVADRVLERVVLALEPPGGGAPSLARLGLRLPTETLRARSALKRHRTQALLGLGGFTTAPAVLAARSLGIPVALLEINAVAGRATRKLAPFCARVYHAWRGTLPAGTSSRDMHTGAPLAPDFVRADAAARDAARTAMGVAPEHALLLVLGGSQGALGLNDFLAASAERIIASGVQILHQVGPGRAQEGAAAVPGYRAVEYIDDVAQAVTAADLILCRGGASTLAEIGAVGTPSWVVPYPHHADRHQESNARELGDGLRIVQEQDLTDAACAELIRTLGSDGQPERERMRSALDGAVPRDAAARIALDLLDLVRT